VSPHAIRLLQSQGHAVDQLRSKGWEEFGAPDAPRMDVVITVCDQAAGEACPVWAGHPITAHWGFEDPAALQGSDEQKQAKFSAVYRQIVSRIRVLVILPLASLDRLAGEQQVRAIGRTKL
jgi:arsenate reductase